MTEDKVTVTDGLVVSLDYTLRLDDGEIIDSSADREPLEFLQGRSQNISVLEQALDRTEFCTRKTKPLGETST